MTAGRYYRLPDGRVAYVYGAGPGEMIHYVFYGDRGRARGINAAGYKDWVETDLKEFPEEKDHRLPYLFDLHWDMKRVSELRFAIRYGESLQGSTFSEEDAKEVREATAKWNLWYGTGITTKDQQAIDRALDRRIKAGRPMRRG